MKAATRLLLLLLFVVTPPFADEQPISIENINLLAGRYQRAEGVKRNYEKSFKLYCISAALGNAEANYHLGWAYFNGRGVKIDHSLAVGWFKKAAHLGDAFSRNLLNRLATIPTKEDHNCPIPSKKQRLSKAQVKVWVEIIASVQEIDSALIIAVIQTESAFEEDAHSHKDARGLMQLIPETALRFGVKDSWNPVENIWGGVSYIRWLTDHFKGNVRLVLAAYNAGEEAVMRHKGVPPYQETEHYVHKIMAQYKKESHPTTNVSTQHYSW